MYFYEKIKYKKIIILYVSSLRINYRLVEDDHLFIENVQSEMFQRALRHLNKSHKMLTKKLHEDDSRSYNSVDLHDDQTTGLTFADIPC